MEFQHPHDLCYRMGQTFASIVISFYRTLSIKSETSSGFQVVGYDVISFYNFAKSTLFKLCHRHWQISCNASPTNMLKQGRISLAEYC